MPWGMREVSHLRGHRRRREGGLELVVPAPPEPEVEAALLRALAPPGGRQDAGETPGEGTAEDGGRLVTAAFPPGGLAGRLFSVEVPAADLLLEKALELEDRGIPVLAPLAAGARRTLGVTRLSAAVFAAGSGPGSLLPLAEALLDPAGRRGLLPAAGGFLRRLHDAGVDPGPGAARAIGVERSAAAPSLAVGNARAMTVSSPLAGPRRARSLGALSASLPRLSPRERLLFLAGYRRGGGGKGRRGEPPLRALHLYANHKATGPAHAALETVRALADLPGVRAELQPGTGPGEKSIVRLARERGVPLAPLGLGLRKHASPAVLGAARRLRDALEESPPDVIHCHLSSDHLAAALGAPPGTAVVRTVHDVEPPRWTWRARRTLLGRADRIVCFTREVGDGLAAAGRGGAAHRSLLEPPVDLERFDRRRPLPDARPALGLPRDAVVFGIAARLQPRRRFDVLLEAFARASRERPDLRLVVIGRGTRDEEAVGEPRRRLGLEDRVVLAGHLEGDRYVAALAALDASVYLVPGSDATCRAARESLALGVPVVAARRGILPRLVRDGTTGLLVECEPGPLAAALLRLAGDPGLRARMGARGAGRRRGAVLAAAARAGARRDLPGGGGGEAAGGRRGRAGAPVIPFPGRAPDGFVCRPAGGGPGMGKVLARAGLDPGAIGAAIARFAAGSPGLRVLKQDRKTSVFAGLDLGGRAVCLKAYRSRRRARRGLANLAALGRMGSAGARGVLPLAPPALPGEAAWWPWRTSTPPPSSTDGSASLLASGPPDGARAELRAVAAALGTELRDLHGRGISARRPEDLQRLPGGVLAPAVPVHRRRRHGEDGGPPAAGEEPGPAQPLHPGGRGDRGPPRLRGRVPARSPAGELAARPPRRGRPERPLGGPLRGTGGRRARALAGAGRPLAPVRRRS